jgi:hypothetical protein
MPRHEHNLSCLEDAGGRLVCRLGHLERRKPRLVSPFVVEEEQKGQRRLYRVQAIDGRWRSAYKMYSSVMAATGPGTHEAILERRDGTRERIVFDAVGWGPPRPTTREEIAKLPVYRVPAALRGRPSQERRSSEVLLPGASPLTERDVQVIEQKTPKGTLVARREGPRSPWEVFFKAGEKKTVAEIRYDNLRGAWRPRFVDPLWGRGKGPYYSSACDALAHIAREIS